jgi:hypothetical protein
MEDGWALPEISMPSLEQESVDFKLILTVIPSNYSVHQIPEYHSSRLSASILCNICAAILVYYPRAYVACQLTYWSD